MSAQKIKNHFYMDSFYQKENEIMSQGKMNIKQYSLKMNNGRREKKKKKKKKKEKKS